MRCHSVEIVEKMCYSIRGGIMQINNRAAVVVKVRWQLVGGAVAGLIVAGLVSAGMGTDDAAQTGAILTPVLILVLPVAAQALGGFVVGWLKSDPDREALYRLLDQAVDIDAQDNGDAARLGEMVTGLLSEMVLLREQANGNRVTDA
jgi:hypothetical protein